MNIQDLDFMDDNEFDDEDTMKNKFLTFGLGKESYGIALLHVIEIVGMQQITEVPDMPDFVKGVINLRGQVIPVMDVRIRFHMEEKKYTDRTCIVVTSVDELFIGLIVDRVDEVVVIPDDEISPPPRLGKGIGSIFIQGLGKTEHGVKILLDVKKLLFGDKMEDAPDMEDYTGNNKEE